MKTGVPLKLNNLRNRRGAALITVLAVLILITTLVVAFLARTGTERTASASYDASSRAKLLADTAINLVQAAINEASTTDGTTMWASQPGAIRVFDDKGDLERIYRLYSAQHLYSDTVTGSILAQDQPGNTWADSPAEWVDLNAPITVAGGVGDSPYTVFPILDPRDAVSPGPVSSPNVNTELDGFALDSARTPGRTALQPAPMPVRWLYVLQDGQIVAPKNPAGKVVEVEGASRANPITGRIAYWTDDDTAKVNINTAAGSQTTTGGQTKVVAWDVPRFTMRDDFKLFSQNQPVHGEYQRYPGHPATTSLYEIFDSLGLSMPSMPYEMPTFATGKNPAPPLEDTQLFALLSRYRDANSSRGGTANTTRFSSAEDIPKVEPGRHRLFSSIGELLYDPLRQVNPDMGRQMLESGKFFLTAQSRAPEVTLFGTPRIAMWPVNSTISGDTGAPPITEFDKLIAFCASTKSGDNTYRYYIQRKDNTSSTVDAAIPRNVELYSYLQNLTSRSIPGFGGKFVEKYEFSNDGVTYERDQILTEMVDYIRSTNLFDHSSSENESQRRRYTPGSNPASGGNQVVPLKIGNTRGLGRMYTISELGIHIIATADGNAGPMYNRIVGADTTGYQEPETIPGYGHKVSPLKGSVNDPKYISNLPEDQYLRDMTGAEGDIVGWDSVAKTVVKIQPGPVSDDIKPFESNPTLASTYGGPKTALTPGNKRLQAMLVLEMFSPMLGNDAMFPDWRIRATDLDNIEIGEPSVTTGDRYPFPAGEKITESMGTRFGNIVQLGGLNSFHYLMTYQGWSGGNVRRNGWSNDGTNVDAKVPYRLVSNPFTVPDSASSLGRIEISSRGISTIEVQTRVGKTASRAYEMVQRFQLDFPRVVVDMPDLIETGIGTSIPWDWWNFDKRFEWATATVADNTNGTNPSQNRGSHFRTDPNPDPNAPTWTPSRTASVRLNYYKNQLGVQGDVSRPSDVVRSLIAKDGDVRLVMARETVAADAEPDSPMVRTAGYDSDFKIAHSFMLGTGSNALTGADLGGKLYPGMDYSPAIAPKVPSNASPQASWDWDSGYPGMRDGAYANKPDEGNIYTNGTAISSNPYWNIEQAGSTDRFPNYFTANRIIPSAVMFGSLPTGVLENIPWRTLLFRPALAASRPRDPDGPKDHLLLDLFSMPVVEPYAISEPFSTAGKINMNYQIVPFGGYIERSTGVRAVLSSELMARVHKRAGMSKTSSSHSTYYRDKDATPAQDLPDGAPPMLRLPIDLEETLEQFEAKFNSWDIFKSASEICDIYLVPEDPNDGDRYTADNMPTVWYGDDFALVGDNVRERPYANIYPRLTTKSNSYTVHFRVQALKNPPMVDEDKWDEGRGVVVGEYRGSTSLERFLDPNNPAIPDYAANPSAEPLDKYYQWRVVANNAFNP